MYTDVGLMLLSHGVIKDDICEVFDGELVDYSHELFNGVFRLFLVLWGIQWGWRWIPLWTPMVMTHKGWSNPSFITKHNKVMFIFIGFSHSGCVRVSNMTSCESKQLETGHGCRGEGEDWVSFGCESTDVPRTWPRMYYEQTFIKNARFYQVKHQWSIMPEQLIQRLLVKNCTI